MRVVILNFNLIHPLKSLDHHHHSVDYPFQHLLLVLLVIQLIMNHSLVLNWPLEFIENLVELVVERRVWMLLKPNFAMSQVRAYLMKPMVLVLQQRLLKQASILTNQLMAELAKLKVRMFWLSWLGVS